ncbi:MAG TPA: uracil-DNA glycosylase family protein [Thermoanaerobaculia bacterium]|nr:uracil-DNA glycosylase family protein [Thermoanaerobaculia bacterium]
MDSGLTPGAEALERHVREVRGCRRCPTVEPPPIIAPPEVWPRVMLVGQAPGPKERDVGRPFAFTAGARLFSWFARLGATEEEFRRRVWICAVIRCFPGRAPQGGDRPPGPLELANCAPFLEEEIRLLRPLTVIAVGQPAIAKFLPEPAPLQDRVGQIFQVERDGHAMEVIPLPHPSGRSTWLVRPENQERLDRALALLAGTQGWRETFASSRSELE